MLVQAYSMPVVFAQTLDLVVDTAIGTGVTAGAGDGETLTRRTPLFIDLDAGFVLDGDYATEYGVGLLMELEGSPAVSHTPACR